MLGILKLYIKLSLSFAKMGILTIGGGMVMLPLIQSEMLKHQWLSEEQFVDILGISEATPGPMALNCATFVGWRVANIPGSAIATLSLVFPAFVSVMVFGLFWQRHQKHPAMQRVMRLLRVVIAGLILSFSINLCMVVLGDHITEGVELARIWRPLGISLVVCAIVVHGKISPVAALMGGAIAGAGLAVL